MIGHQQIIDARKRGLKPSAIFFDAGFDVLPARFDFQKPERALDWGLHPTVTLTAEELAQRHDLRFVTGCQVHASGSGWSDGLLHFLDRLVDCKPHMVVACCIEESPLIMIWQNKEWRTHA